MAASCCQAFRAVLPKTAAHRSRAARAPPSPRPPAAVAALRAAWPRSWSCAGNSHPQRLLLRWIQQQAARRCRVHPRLRGQSSSSRECWARAMRSGPRPDERDGSQGKKARRSVAGCDDQAALAEPTINLSCRQSPHSSFILCRPWTGHSGPRGKPSPQVLARENLLPKLSP